MTPSPWSPLACCSLLLLAACGPAQPPATSTPPAAPPGTPATPPPPATSLRFEDITPTAGLDFVHFVPGQRIDNILVSDGSGGAILDFDGDGWMDVFLVNAEPTDAAARPSDPGRTAHRLFRNRGDGTLTDVTAQAGVAGGGFGTTAAAADYDNDGHTDLLVVAFDRLILYRNRGDGTFADVTAAAGLVSRRTGISATFLDLDRDGYLDLLVANYLAFDPAIPVPPGAQVPYPGPLAYPPEFNLLYRNRGDGTFEEISEEAGIRIPDHRAMSVTPLDFDLDGDTDLYVSNDATANQLLVNDGRGHFRDEALRRGIALNAFGVAEGSMGAAVGDANGDGWPDLLITRFGTASLYFGSAQGYFEDRATPAGIVEASLHLVAWGGNFLDADNDGDLDLFVANGDPHFMKGMPSLLLENDGTGRFTSVGPQAGPCFREPLNARGSGAFDLDHDGRLDLVVCTLGDRPRLFLNRTPQTGHWLTLVLEGTRSNRDGLGTLVRLGAGGRRWTAEARCPTSYVFQQDPRLHFGLGPSAAADRLELRWPSGTLQILTNVPADRILTLREPGASRWTKGSP